MKHLLLYFFLLIPCIGLMAQDNDNPIADVKVQDSIKVVDDKYREDQFYVSITYNLLGNKPDGVSQSGFSSGFHFGFIRDMPINDKRNIAIGLGLGLSTNSYNQTLLISKFNNDFAYSVIDGDVSFSKNKFTTYLLEVPLEFRWRTSTPTDYNFWRIYGGIKFGYIVYNSSKFNGSADTIKLSNIDDFNDFQYGLTLSAGYSNVNFHLYYALNSIFSNEAKLESSGSSIDMNTVKIGLIFYIL
ncbi:porin family protein [Psychroserpens algicola]|uniref:PorT family protein n=1 Tax=Psychroserpens algicola TaxID=1719034 RepID=A0ABT0H9I7_9FLAO|nr:porin family protein [Psychroserpens algicola]MCK8481028.1 PorT family protein [Psychroserpens algicola]